MRVVVRVNQEHISKGRRNSPTQCAVALAIMDRLPGCGARVGGSYGVILFSRPERWWERIGLSDAVATFVARFDQGKEVAPFSFYLNTDNRSILEAAGASGLKSHYHKRAEE